MLIEGVFVGDAVAVSVGITDDEEVTEIVGVGVTLIEGIIGYDGLGMVVGVMVGIAEEL